MLLLLQIQDAGNHLANALNIVADMKDNKACLTSADKVVNVSHSPPHPSDRQHLSYGVYLEHSVKYSI